MIFGITAILDRLDLFGNCDFHSSILSIAEIKLNLRPNLFRLFLYLSDTTLNRFIIPITSSFATRSLASSWFFFLSSFVKGFFLRFFFGSSDLACSFCIP